ncbi:hypothetical protein M758_3G162000 [Ceratodon purpureus]|nr:hypothetical protein M758_3G162000 [Ceratodon purpureus]
MNSSLTIKHRIEALKQPLRKKVTDMHYEFHFTPTCLFFPVLRIDVHPTLIPRTGSNARTHQSHPSRPRIESR